MIGPVDPTHGYCRRCDEHVPLEGAEVDIDQDGRESIVCQSCASEEIRTAGPYQARQCANCGRWIFTDAPPYAEDDRTKTMRDWLHYERCAGIVDDGATVIGFPFMRYNETPVEALFEDHSETTTEEQS